MGGKINHNIKPNGPAIKTRIKTKRPEKKIKSLTNVPINLEMKLKVNFSNQRERLKPVELVVSTNLFQGEKREVISTDSEK